MFERGGLADRATLERGDALEIAAAVDGPIDLVVLDHDTADYVRGVDIARDVLAPGGTSLADNVASYGDVLTPAGLSATLDGEPAPNDRTRVVARVLEHARATPLPWHVGVQAYRSVGAVFLVVWWLGGLPAFFALPAGIGDVRTGAGAAVVAALAAAGTRRWRSAVVGWNAFGLADLVVAAGAGSTLLAGPLSAVLAASCGRSGPRRSPALPGSARRAGRSRRPTGARVAGGPPATA